MILSPELAYQKIRMVPAAAHGLEWAEGVGHGGSKPLDQPLKHPQHPFLLLEQKRSHGKQSADVFSSEISSYITLKLQLSMLEVGGRLEKGMLLKGNAVLLLFSIYL